MTAAAFNTAFYETLAGVIPVLIALLYFDGRFRRFERETPIQMYFASIGILLLVVALVNALAALYRKEAFAHIQFRSSLLLCGSVWGTSRLVFCSPDWPASRRPPNSG